MIPAPASLLFAFRGGELLVRETGDGLELPRLRAGEPHGLPATVEEPFSAPDGAPCQAVALADDAVAPEGLAFRPLRRTYGHLPDPLFALAGRASQLLEWSRSHRFCGRCGAPTTSVPHEHAKLCEACGVSHYPRLSPAVIVAVRRGESILLGRAARFAEGMYTVLAGFVEPGESLEEAVSREIGEEVGIQVGEIRYFGSQPWPFPHSLMIAFTAEYLSGEVSPNPDELEAAAWFTADAMPMVPPRLSIARSLIENFVREQGGDPGALVSPP
jgi:NAD+ diphosphatase